MITGKMCQKIRGEAPRFFKKLKWAEVLGIGICVSMR
jgi:hypothetical protein